MFRGVNQNRLLTIAVVTMILASILMVGVTGLWVRQQNRFDPFGDFPVQTVLNEAEGYEPPAARVGEPIELELVRCYDEDVNVTEVVYWRMVSPEVSFFVSDGGTADRLPGCVTELVSSPWPAQALSLSRKYLEQGAEVYWQIIGSETPSEGGVTQTWETQNFRVVDDGS